MLIVSSRISRNKCVMSDTKACYEHWADADISFLRKEKTACVCTLHFALLHFVSLFGIISRPPTPIDGFLYHAGASSSSFHITLSRRLLTTIPRANLERLDEHASTDRLFREQVHAELPAEIPCIIINSPLLFLAQRIVYS